MSNEVWGTPTVAGDLLYVTSFEVHALDVASGRRQFKTRDVAWSMAVADGRIHASDGPSLFALDATDGSERWRVSADAWVYALRAEHGTVVTATRGGGVQGWEASNGHKLWELTGAQTDFETPEAAPVLHDGTVYVWQDARLRALDARTGRESWSYPVGDAASCANVPVRVTPAPDGNVYVAAGTRVLSVDRASGRVRWHFEAPAVFLAAPAFAPGAAVTGGGVYLADHLGTVYALDAVTGKDRWRIATEPRPSADPVLVVGGNVHLGAGSALYTLDAVTGTPKWRFAAGGEITGPPAVADGRVHFGSADHCLYTLDAAGASCAGSSPRAGRSRAPRWRRRAWCTRAARTAACTPWTRPRGRVPAPAPDLGRRPARAQLWPRPVPGPVPGSGGARAPLSRVRHRE
ncbi:hypothetical protein GCM10020254_48710 [Streptomyces goshikiensis]